MSKKVLIAFATVTWTTRGTANVIAQELSSLGIETEVLRVDQVRSVQEYGAVVVGGPVMMGMLNGKLKKFVRKYRRALETVPVVLFVTCGMAIEAKEESQAKAAGYIDKLRALLPGATVIASAALGGGIKTDGEDFEHAPFYLKGMIKAVAKEMPTGGDEQKLRDWAKEVAGKMV